MFRTTAFAAVFALSVAGAAVSQPTAGPSDPQIAHIAYTAGQIDITAADQALAKTKNPDVRTFAESMKRDHAAVNEQALALVKKLGVTPEANPTSAALSAQAGQSIAKLSRLNGVDFDRAYIQHEVTYHQAVNDALKNTLIPNADNSELKSLLQTGLKLFQEHQIHAEHVAQVIK